MDLHLLSKSYTVRKLDEADVDAIFELMRKNEIFYKYHPPFVTKESILEDMKALPPQKSYEDKYYIGFFEDEALVANMDLILSYPTEQIAFIGFFMTDVQYQNKGIGSKIIREVCACIKSLGYLCENGIDFVGTIIRTRQNSLCFDFDAAVAALFAWVDGENVETDETKTPEYHMLCKIYRLTKPGLGIPSASFSDDAAVRFYEQWDALKRAPQTDANRAALDVLERYKAKTDHCAARLAHFAARCRQHPAAFYLTHGDAGGNFFVGNGRNYILDWDEVMYAPLERDAWVMGCYDWARRLFNDTLQANGIDDRLCPERLAFYCYHMFLFYLGEFLQVHPMQDKSQRIRAYFEDGWILSRIRFADTIA